MKRMNGLLFPTLKNYKKEYQKIVIESYEENPGCTYNLIYMMIFRNW